MLLDKIHFQTKHFSLEQLGVPGFVLCPFKKTDEKANAERIGNGVQDRGLNNCKIRRGICLQSWGTRSVSCACPCSGGSTLKWPEETRGIRA